LGLGTGSGAAQAESNKKQIVRRFLQVMRQSKNPS
jgi:hypothetical protein